MSLSERVQQLNREIGATVERAVADLRREVAERLRAGQEEVLRRIEEIAPELPASFLAHDELDPAIQAAAETAAQAAVPVARHGAFAELRESLAAIDRGRSQADILTALLAETGRFASRSALLLARGNEVRGWGGSGFGDSEAAIRGVAFEASEGRPWGRVLQGGPVRLSASDCAELCSRLEAPLPQDGVLVPLVLRDRTAAALYADRTDGADLSVEALQLLLYAAALAIETLPFRERASTATLELVEGAPVIEPAAPVSEPEPEPAEPESAEPAAWSEPAGVAYVEEVEDGVEDVEVEIEAEPAPADAAYSSYTAIPEPEPMAGEPAWEVEAEPEPDPTTPWTAPVDHWDAPANGVAEELPPVVEEPAASTVPAYEAEPVEPAAAFTAELPRLDDTAATAPPELPAPPAYDVATGPLQGPQDTVLLPRSSFREPEPPRGPAPVAPVAPLRPVAAPPPPPPATESVPGGTSEVQPPSDVQGPGWAFATTRVPVSPNDEALHEEARRLARLLVSEIKLYNEEQVEEGRRNRDVYERLKEDIDRSRQMYEERVEPRILKSTDYFYQEL
ncbi:MAG TPA: hypothetical protein VMW27_30690, partial [Thermoanaerobaculia bacterium]|nr:hypothetical protein [Thermoanaerobaculia bacterium]